MLATLTLAQKRILRDVEKNDVLAIQCYAADDEDLGFERQLLFRTALSCGNLDSAQAIFDLSEISINQYDGLFLNLAVSSNNIDVVKFILAAGADPTLSQQTSLELASAVPNFEVLLVILENILRYSCEINPRFLKTLLETQTTSTAEPQEFINSFASLLQDFKLENAIPEISLPSNIRDEKLRNYYQALKKMAEVNCSSQTIFESSKHPLILREICSLQKASIEEIEALVPKKLPSQKTTRL